MGEQSEKRTPWRFIPHPDAERFDGVVVETVERWKESELSGDEWRFSYVATFYRHGVKAAVVGGASIADALLRAAALYRSTETDDEGGFYGNLAEFCCQPGCHQPWTVLMHPVKAYSRSGGELVRPYDEQAVRGFCERHKNRGDCALDDAERNYVVVEERFPPTWAEEQANG